MSGLKKKQKRLVKLRAKQHRRLEPTDFVVPKLNLDRVPQLRMAQRIERRIRDAADAVLDESIRTYLAACKAKSERAEIVRVFRAVERADFGGRFRAAFDKAESAFGHSAIPMVLTDEIERSLEAYALLVAIADWVADNNVHEGAPMSSLAKPTTTAR